MKWTKPKVIEYGGMFMSTARKKNCVAQMYWSCKNTDYYFIVEDCMTMRKYNSKAEGYIFQTADACSVACEKCIDAMVVQRTVPKIPKQSRG